MENKVKHTFNAVVISLSLSLYLSLPPRGWGTSQLRAKSSEEHQTIVVDRWAKVD
jgi:hypothetical protein